MKNSTFLMNLKHQFGTQKGKLITYLILKTFIFFSAIILPIIFAQFIDNISTGTKNVKLITFLFFGISFLAILCTHFSNLINVTLNASSVFYSSQDSIKKYISSSLEVLSKRETAYITTRIINDTRAVITFVLENLTDIVLGVIQGVIILIIIFKFNKNLFFIFCILIPINIVIFNLFKNKISKISGTVKEVAAQYSSANQKQVKNYLYIKLNGILDISTNYVKKYFTKVLSGFSQYKKLTSYLDSSVSIIKIIATTLLMIFGGRLIMKGEISIGYFTALNSYFITLMTIINSTTISLREMVFISESIKRMNDILHEPKELSGNITIKEILNIKIKEFKLSFNDVELFSPVNMLLENGNTYYIQGKNGIGKSSFLKALIGGYRDYGGEILINDTNIKEVNICNFRREHITYLPQEPVLFFETYLDIITMGGAIENKKGVIQNLKKLFDCEDPIALIKSRLQEEGESVELRFSGGEKQKIALAVALASNSSIIILDEPTAALDIKTKKIFLEILNEDHSNIILVISHDNKVINSSHNNIALV